MHVLFLSLVVLAATATDAERADTSAPKRVLISTGEDHKAHIWKLTAPALKNLLAEDRRMAVEVNEDLAFLRSPKLHEYDVVVMHFRNLNPKVPGREGYENLQRFVSEGGGLVMVHAACAAFREFSDDFVKLAGRTWDFKSSKHSKLVEFGVEIVDHEHPITKELHSFKTVDELYYDLGGETPIRVLATARFDGDDHPIAFVLTCGKGRVFHSPLGHNVEALSAAAKLFRRGTAWVAGLSP